MPSHASHLLQPLDLSIFGPLKTYLAREIDRFTRTGISRLQKQEWVRAYCQARPLALCEKNIASGFKNGGLIPYAPTAVLRQVPSEFEPEQAIVKGPGTQTSFTFTSPCKIEQLHETNQQLKRILSSQNKKELESPVKRYIFNLAEVSELMKAQLVITEKESQDKEKVLEARKRQRTGKRTVIKDKVLVTTKELLDGVEKAEVATEAKGAGKKKEKALDKVMVVQENLISEGESEQEVWTDD